jgi:hypothetical protein
MFIALIKVYYDTYVMPLRGLPIAAKYGQNVLLMNAELRTTIFNVLLPVAWPSWEN